MRDLDRQRLARALRSSEAAATNVLPFRRRAAVRHSRRHPLLRLATPLLGAIAIVGLPAAAAFWLLTSPRFALAEVRVVTDEQGTDERVPAAWVEQQLAPRLGENLVRLPLEQARQALAGHPWLRSVGLRKELPGALWVQVVERRAAALLSQEGELYYLDPEGEPIAPFDPRHGITDLLVISRAEAAAAHPRGAIELAAEIEALEPPWGKELSEIELLGEEDFRIYLAGLPFPLLVRAGSLRSKARRLEALLPRILDRYGTVAALDLRFSRRIIVQPSASGRQTPRT